MTRKIAVVAVALLELVVIGSVIGLRVTHWHQAGWTGFTYHPEYELPEAIPDLPMLGQSLTVLIVIPGSPADRAGIKISDRVLAVNGVASDDIGQLRRLSDELSVGSKVQYDLEREEQRLQLEVVIESPLRSPFQVFNLVTNVICGLIWLGISLLVYWSRPGSRVAGVFFAMCASGAAVYLLWAGGELDYPGLRGILPYGTEADLFILVGLTSLVTILLSNLILHMALVFPKPRPVAKEWPQVFLWIHLLPFTYLAALLFGTGILVLIRGIPLLVAVDIGVAVTAALVAVSLKRTIGRDGWWRGLRSSPWRVLALLLMAVSQAMLLLQLASDLMVGIIFGFMGLFTVLWIVVWLLFYAILAAVSLYRSYRESGLELRQQVRWPLWGTVTSLLLWVVVTLCAVVYGLLQTKVTGQTYELQLSAAFISKLVYLLIPISFAFAILKYRLLDIDVIIRKTVIYTAVTSFLIGVYLVLAGVSGLALVRSIGVESQSATVVATLAAVALFVPVRNRVQRFVDRRFFQREQDLEEATRQIADTVLHGADPAQTLPRVADAVQRALHTGGLAILVRPPGGDRLVVDTTLGLGERALTGISVSHNDPALLAGGLLDTEALSGELATLAQAARARLMAVVRRDGRPAGLLLIGRPQGRADYEEGELAFIATVADQVALAVGRSMQRQSEGELEQARAIQRSLLPQTLPEVAGLHVAARWEPAREVSGDYYDIIRLDDSRMLVCIGDVVGKGLPAALLMSTLQAAVKAVAATTDAPSRICEQVRNVVCHSLSGGTFVTFFCAVVDRLRLTLSSANAGHNPPILARRSGEIVRLEQGGPAIARLLTSGYVEEETSLEPGDRLLLFTDGATEAMNPDGEMFGDERLQRLAAELVTTPVAEAERGIASTVIAHARGVLQDDLTLVLVGVE
jgi:hypothetical protein